jgi:hypothetical protein
MSSARIIVFLFALFACAAAHAVVRYDEGNRVIEGVQVLQDADDPRVY